MIIWYNTESDIIDSNYNKHGKLILNETTNFYNYSKMSDQLLGEV